ncbi:hypothetical protein [Vibrio metschnikovii]|uniref:hypothetical protein n=1 Tax=Vibrio metschnikovii TaxID=28172 RepID=UPI002FCC96E0
MIVSNPVNIQPFIDEMRNDLNRSLELMNSAHVETVNSLLTGLDNALEGITAINGEISTEVSAINSFTLSSLNEMKSSLLSSMNKDLTQVKNTVQSVSNSMSVFSSVKRIIRMRVQTNGTNYAVTIPAVNVDKTLIVLSTSLASNVPSEIAVRLVNSNTVNVDVRERGEWRHVDFQVVEYA